VPQGQFNHSGTLTADGITVFGSGSGSVLFGTDPSHETIYMTGSGASLSSVELSTSAGDRQSSLDSTAVCPDGATNYTISNITIERAGSAGILNYGSDHGTITNNTVMDTNADSIHMTNGTHDMTIQGNLIERSGDDSISVVNYGTDSPDSYSITIQGNTILDQQWGRGIVIAGGHEVQIAGNHVEGGPADRAGIYIAAEPRTPRLATTTSRSTATRSRTPAAHRVATARSPCGTAREAASPTTTSPSPTTGSTSPARTAS
jgi:hypothetical protein